MQTAVNEITFVPMKSSRKPETAAPSALNMPGWKRISEAIKDAVDTCGVPVTVLAERTNLTRQYIYSMMNGTCNPSMDKVEAVMLAAGTSLEHWIDDVSLYGRDKRLHDQLQGLLNQKGTNAVAIRRTIEALVALSSDSNEVLK